MDLLLSHTPVVENTEIFGWLPGEWRYNDLPYELGTLDQSMLWVHESQSASVSMSVIKYEVRFHWAYQESGRTVEGYAPTLLEAFYRAAG